MLDVLGVTPRLRSLYEHLLATPGQSVHELAARTDESVATVEAWLGELVDLGFVSVEGDTPTRFVPSPPEVAVEALVQERREGLERARRYATRLSTTYRSGWNEERASQYVEVLVGARSVTQRFQQLQRQATEQVIVLVKPPYLGSHDDQERTERTLLDGGVRVRGLYDRTALEEDGGFELVTRLLAVGEEARVLPRIPLKLAIADEDLALVALAPEGPGSDSAILVRPSGLLDALVLLTETLWAQAAPIAHRPHQGGPPSLDGRDQEVLELLQAGLTDANVARQLGVAERTVRRRVRRLMDRAGVTSRFQLGWRAGDAGWLHSTPDHPSP